MPKTRSKQGRRELLKKAVYLAPAIVTLPVLPSFASAGSGRGNSEVRSPRRKQKRTRRGT